MIWPKCNLPRRRREGGERKGRARRSPKRKDREARRAKRNETRSKKIKDRCARFQSAAAGLRVASKLLMLSNAAKSVSEKDAAAAAAASQPISIAEEIAQSIDEREDQMVWKEMLREARRENNNSGGSPSRSRRNGMKQAAGFYWHMQVKLLLRPTMKRWRRIAFKLARMRNLVRVIFRKYLLDRLSVAFQHWFQVTRVNFKMRFFTDPLTKQTMHVLQRTSFAGVNREIIPITQGELGNPWRRGTVATVLSQARDIVARAGHANNMLSFRRRKPRKYMSPLT